MKHVFIINPYAGKKDSETFIPTIEEYFKSRNLDNYEIIITEKGGHATEIAKQYHKEDDVCLYGVGGDGTIFEVLNGINEGVRMAIIPNGTGNDYFKMLEVEEKDIKNLLIQTIEGKDVLVDYGIANERRYLNASSMGLDADINQRANEIGKTTNIPKSLVYIVAAIQLLFKKKPMHMKVTLDDNPTMDVTCLMTGVMVGRFYGGGFLPTPMASLQDGKLDVFIIEDMSLLKVFKVFPKYMKGTHVGMKECQFYKAEKVVLESDTPVLYGCDGEPVLATHIDYQIKKEGLILRVPMESKLQ